MIAAFEDAAHDEPRSSTALPDLRQMPGGVGGDVGAGLVDHPDDARSGRGPAAAAARWAAWTRARSRRPGRAGRRRRAGRGRTRRRGRRRAAAGRRWPRACRRRAAAATSAALAASTASVAATRASAMASSAASLVARVASARSSDAVRARSARSTRGSTGLPVRSSVGVAPACRPRGRPGGRPGARARALMRARVVVRAAGRRRRPAAWTIRPVRQAEARTRWVGGLELDGEHVRRAPCCRRSRSRGWSARCARRPRARRPPRRGSRAERRCSGHTRSASAEASKRLVGLLPVRTRHARRTELTARERSRVQDQGSTLAAVSGACHAALLDATRHSRLTGRSPPDSA